MNTKYLFTINLGKTTNKLIIVEIEKWQWFLDRDLFLKLCCIEVGSLPTLGPDYTLLARLNTRKAPFTDKLLCKHSPRTRDLRCVAFETRNVKKNQYLSLYINKQQNKLKLHGKPTEGKLKHVDLHCIFLHTD